MRKGGQLSNSSEERELPLFNYQERFLITLGIAIVIFSALGIFAGKTTVIFTCLMTLALVGWVLFKQYSDLRAAAVTIGDSEERFRLLVNEVQDYAIFAVADDGKIVSWNHGAERITGYAAADVIERPFAMLRAQTEGRTELNSRVFDTALKNGRHTEEAWLQTKTGRRFMASTTITPLHTASGKLRGYSIVTWDITAKKEAEHQLSESYHFIQHVTEAIPELLYIFEVDTLKKIYLNDTRAVLEYTPAALAALGEQFFAAVVHPEDSAKFDSLKERLAGLSDPQSLEFECRMRAAGGEWRCINWRFVVFARSEQGAPTQCLGVGQDVSQLKCAQEDAAKAQAAALNKERLALLGELSASVAHEFRNPLQGVMNCVEELRTDWDDDPKMKGTLELLYEGLQRMDHISGRLLRLSRSMDSEKLPADVLQTVETTCAFIRSRAQKCGVQVEMRVQPGLPPVPMNAERISEALLNLINNAIDACAPGGRVVVSANLRPISVETLGKQAASTGSSELSNETREDSELPPTMLEFTVADNGCGIPPESRNRIFDTFFTTKPAGKGTGLGMTIVRKNIEAHGGIVELMETSERGTTFQALIPVRVS